MRERPCALNMGLLVIALMMATQGLIARSQRVPEESRTLREQVSALQEHDRVQEAEIKLLKRQLARAKAMPRVLEAGEEKSELIAAEKTLKEEGVEEKGEEGEEKEEGEEEEGEGELEEEAADPVELTLAISLLSYITIIMTLFWLVNYEDEGGEMKIYVWGVLSNTLSIFLAVLSFTSLNGLSHQLVPDHASVGIVILVDFCQLIFCFAMMQFAVAYISGALEDQPIDPNLDIAPQKEQRERRFKSVATLLAHMSGFAAINLGGGIQHLEILQQNPPLTFVVPPVLFFFQLIACRGVRKMRRGWIEKILLRHGIKSDYMAMQPEEPGKQNNGGGIEWCVEKWDDETYESENEISSLAISFLLLQAIRYNITGIMPDNMGVEEEHYQHPASAVILLGVAGVVLAVLCCVIVVWSSESFPEGVEIAPGTMKSFMKRIAIVLQGTTAMGFAWALMYVSKWQISIIAPEINPNCVEARVVLALCISVFAFFIILGLDKIADLDSTGEKTDKAIIAIITSLSILVGFTWEQAFDGAVEILSEVCFKAHPIMAETTLTVGIFIIVYPQWRKYVLKTLLRLKYEYRLRQEGVAR